MDIRNNRNAGVRLLLAAILTCIMLGLFGQLARAQNLTPITDTSIVYRLDDFSKWEYLPNVHPVFDFDETIEAASKPSIYKGGSLEYHIGTPWISERNKSAIIEYLINLIIELMEPGETITIKKLKE